MPALKDAPAAKATAAPNTISPAPNSIVPSSPVHIATAPDTSITTGQQNKIPRYILFICSHVTIFVIYNFIELANAIFSM